MSCIGYVISALVPLSSAVARNAEQLRLLTKWGNIIDTCAMLAFLFGGFVYAITWQRDDEDRQKWTIRWKWEGAPAWINKWVGFKDWNWWAMTANLLGRICHACHVACHMMYTCVGVLISVDMSI